MAKPEVASRESTSHELVTFIIFLHAVDTHRCGRILSDPRRCSFAANQTRTSSTRQPYNLFPLFSFSTNAGPSSSSSSSQWSPSSVSTSCFLTSTSAPCSVSLLAEIPRPPQCVPSFSWSFLKDTAERVPGETHTEGVCALQLQLEVTYVTQESRQLLKTRRAAVDAPNTHLRDTLGLTCFHLDKLFQKSRHGWQRNIHHCSTVHVTSVEPTLPEGQNCHCSTRSCDNNALCPAQQLGERSRTFSEINSSNVFHHLQTRHVSNLLNGPWLESIPKNQPHHFEDSLHGVPGE